jgi:hypothetical protein
MLLRRYLMQFGPFTELLFILHPGIPAEILQRFERGPMHIMFLRAGDGCDVQDLGVPPDDPALLATVQAPHMWHGFTYQLFGTYETPESPPEAPRFYLCGPGPIPQGATYPHITSLPLIAWRRRVYHEPYPVYLEARWHHSLGESLTIKGLEHDTRKSTLDKVLKAIKLLEAIEGRGRPYYTSRYYSKDAFLAAWPGKVAEAKQQRNGGHTRDEDIARAYGISPATLARYVRDYGRPEFTKSTSHNF